MTCSDNSINAYYSYGMFACMAANTGPVCEKLVPHHREDEGFLICTKCSSGLNYLEQCLVNCNQIRSQRVNGIGICVCPSNSSLLIAGTCYDLQTCPLKMYVNFTRRACLSCEFGCATCEASWDVTVCTSCYPGYILFLATRPTCKLDSSLLDCSGDMQMEQGYICLPSIINGTYRQCLSVVPNCRVCLIGSAEKCVLCKKDFVLFNNTCLLKCDSRITFEYRGVCVQNNPSDKSCLKQSVASVHSYALISYAHLVNSSTYSYYVNGNTQTMNNIAGYLLSRSKAAGSYETYFIEASYRCLKCADGYGVDSEGKCQPCAFPCVTCIQPHNDSCLSCIPQAYRLEGRTCVMLLELCSEGQFRNHLNSCVYTCPTFYLKEATTLLNCSDSCPEGLTPIV